MRIIAGTAGRTAIKVPAVVTRPTTDFVRQAVFSILGEKVVGARVLDLFAGSGALGLEALSRGAASCTFVDEHRQAVVVIAENLAKARLTGGFLVKSEVATFLKRDAGTYDIVFADPPYWKYHGDADLAGQLLKAGSLAARLAPGGWCILEVSSHWKLPADSPMPMVDRREYGSSAVMFFGG
jgi:16S rRNA (guanine966-N2)-methyltransferase